jgi:hypothetical protein
MTNRMLTSLGFALVTALWPAQAADGHRSNRRGDKNSPTRRLWTLQFVQLQNSATNWQLNLGRAITVCEPRLIAHLRQDDPRLTASS